MKHVFVSQWGAVAPHHPTQMADVIGAGFISYSQLRDGFSSSIITAKTLYEAESALWCSRSVSDFIDLKNFVTFGKEIEFAKREKPKLILFDLEGLTYLSLSCLGKQAPNEALEYFAMALAYADLVIVGSESSAQAFKALVPEANIEAFGFIPEETTFYDYCAKNPIFVYEKAQNEIWAGIGSKVGLARGGLFDCLAISEFRKHYDEPLNVCLFPLTNGVNIHTYSVLSRGLAMDLEQSKSLSYSDFLRQLAALDIVINLDPLDGASRLASECARVKTPCIGLRHSMYQKKYFDDISVDSNDLEEVAAIAHELIEGGKSHPSVIKAYELAREDDRDAHISQWKQMLKGIGVEL